MSCRVDDPERPTFGAETSILRTKAGRMVEGGAAEQRERAVGGDRVPRNARDSGVHGKEEMAIMADLDPTRRRLEVREGRGSDRGQRAVAGHLECRDRPIAGASVGVGDKQLSRVRGPELASERTGALGRKG